MRNIPVPNLSEVDTKRELLGLLGAGVAVVGIGVFGWGSGYGAEGNLEKAVGVLFAVLGAYLFVRKARES